MVTCQSSELGWEVTVELSADFLSLGRGSVSMLQLCVDYWKLNKMTVKNKYPLPRIDDLFD